MNYEKIIFPSRVLFDPTFISLNRTINNSDSDLKSKALSQNYQSSTLDKRIKELEYELASVKTSSEEIKAKLTKEIDDERQLSHAMKLESIRKSEETVKKEMELTHYASNLEIKLSEAILTKDDLSKEIDHLQYSLDSLKTSTDNKVNMLEDQHKQAVSYLNSTISLLKKENEDLRASTREELKRLLEEKDKQIKSYEQGLIEMKHLKDEYEKNNIFLKKEFSEMKIEKDNEMRDRETKLAAESNRLKANIIKEYSEKFASYNNEKEELAEKYSKFNEEFQVMSKVLTEEKVRIEKEYSKCKADNIRLEKENMSLTLLVNKSKIELEKKEEAIASLKSQLHDTTLSIDSNHKQSIGTINELKLMYNKDKIEWQKEKKELENQIETLTYDLQSLKRENEKNAKERNSFKDNLKKDLVKIIDARMKDIKI